jgi:mannan polymerase II complex MNN11 subunit
MFLLMIPRWHATILGRLALVPQKIMNSYHTSLSAKAAKNGTYSEGDFILTFGECKLPGGSCAEEMRSYLSVS